MTQNNRSLVLGAGDEVVDGDEVVAAAEAAAAAAAAASKMEQGGVSSDNLDTGSPNSDDARGANYQQFNDPYATPPVSLRQRMVALRDRAAASFNEFKHNSAVVSATEVFRSSAAGFALSFVNNTLSPLIPIPLTGRNLGQLTAQYIPVQASDFSYTTINMMWTRWYRSSIGGDYAARVNAGIRAGVDFLVHNGVAVGASYAIRAGMEHYVPDADSVTATLLSRAIVSFGQTLAVGVQQPVAAGARWITQSLFGRPAGQIAMQQKAADELQAPNRNSDGPATAPSTPTSQRRL